MVGSISDGQFAAKSTTDRGTGKADKLTSSGLAIARNCPERTPMNALLLPLALTFGAEPAADWAVAEAAHLKNIKPVTADFVRAGEGYFSPDGKKIIFQAEEKGSDNPFYQIFVQDLETGQYRRISPGIGRTTCSFFRPDGKR